MKINKLLILSAVTFLLLTPFVSAGPVIGGTRIIYNAEKNEASIAIKNSGNDGVYLIQSWIDAGDGISGQSVPLVVTPPLFRMEPGDENIMRIIFSGGKLPTDRESIFWLNVRSIPSSRTDETDDNKLQVIVKSRIKIFYRPKGLPGEPIESYKQINVKRYADSFVIENPTPYFISFHNIKISGREVGGVHMIPPRSSKTFDLPKSKEKTTISWQVINDYGGISPSQEITL